MLHEYLKLNKNILIAFAASLIISAIIAQLLSEQTEYLNATYTTIADYVIYFSVFSFLFYLDNRKKYILESGKTDTVKLKHDLKKLITSLGIGEIVYTIFRGILQYYFLIISYDPYLASIISVKVVKNSEEAIKHINKYGTMHTDSIVTKNKKTAKYFLKNVKSSIAMHNTSTQFADGGEFGFGGEVGISTNTLPPRGPVGLNQLISYKYEITSNGKIRN